ncbi:Hypothetical predicted protein [Podarcis lilfordi]|uniref:Uncharacterized protein n=1 Tax=Podarcis lilfordi TaxID=74358 RepID=A0AA35P2N1_9SAUR|nr:Hypothetical predicted protein [Podarcis lilfordi]
MQKLQSRAGNVPLPETPRGKQLPVMQNNPEFDVPTGLTPYKAASCVPLCLDTNVETATAIQREAGYISPRRGKCVACMWLRSLPSSCSLMMGNINALPASPFLIMASIFKRDWASGPAHPRDKVRRPPQAAGSAGSRGRPPLPASSLAAGRERRHFCGPPQAAKSLGPALYGGLFDPDSTSS